MIDSVMLAMKNMDVLHDNRFIPFVIAFAIVYAIIGSVEEINRYGNIEKKDNTRGS